MGAQQVDQDRQQAQALAIDDDAQLQIEPVALWLSSTTAYQSSTGVTSKPNSSFISTCQPCSRSTGRLSSMKLSQALSWGSSNISPALSGNALLWRVAMRKPISCSCLR